MLSASVRPSSPSWAQQGDAGGVWHGVSLGLGFGAGGGPPLLGLMPSLVLFVPFSTGSPAPRDHGVIQVGKGH